MERHPLRIDNTLGPQRPFYPPVTATASRRIVQARTGASTDASDKPSTGSRKASLVGRNLRRRFRHPSSRATPAAESPAAVPPYAKASASRKQ